MTDVFVNQGPKPLVFSGVFGGSVVDLETNTYTVPAGSEAWAGFANEDTSTSTRSHSQTVVTSPSLRLRRHPQRSIPV